VRCANQAHCPGANRMGITVSATLGNSKIMGAQTIAPARDSANPAAWRLKVTFCLDVAMLISICALQTVRFTGLVLHEWLGLAMVAMVLAHLLFAWSWIASQTRRLFTLPSIRARINYLLNLSLFAALTAVIFSGMLISQKAIPTLTGMKAPPAMDWRWDTLHNQFSDIVLMLAGFHLAINWEWTLAAGQKIFRRFLEGTR
jgi:cytochrome b